MPGNTKKTQGNGRQKVKDSAQTRKSIRKVKKGGSAQNGSCTYSEHIENIIDNLMVLKDTFTVSNKNNATDVLTFMPETAFPLF